MTEEARKLLEKAERALNAAKTLLRAGDAEFAAGPVLLRNVPCCPGSLASRRPAIPQAFGSPYRIRQAFCQDSRP